jgi:hypothetical protein
MFALHGATVGGFNETLSRVHPFARSLSPS